VVTIADGEFSVLVGAGSVTAGTPLGYSETAKGPPTLKINDLSVFAGATRYLGVTIDDGTVAVDNEVSPRQQIVSSAYALRARYAEQLGSNGGTALTALDSGNVGIGNTNPPSRFTITAAGTGTSTPQLLLTADDITERLRIGVDSTGTGTGYIQSFKEGTGVQNLLLNPNGGNVGIGTTTPAVALSVVGAITGTGAITGGSFSTAGAVTATGLITGGSLVTSGGNVGIGTVTPTARLDLIDGTTSGTYGSAQISRPATGHTGSHLAFVRAGGQVMGLGYAQSSTTFGFGGGTSGAFSPNILAIDGNGKVGIGTTIPSNYLSVEGGGQVAAASTSTAVAHFGGADVHTYFGSYNGASSYATWMQAMRPSDQMTFPMAINPNGGNVGIGTATPAYKLDVSGTAHVSGQMNVDGAFVMGDGPPIYGKNTLGGVEPAFWPRSSNGTYINYGTNGFYIRNNASVNTMTMTNGGIVSVGTGTSSGRLNIGTTPATYYRYGGLGSDGGSSSNTQRTNNPVSIWADGTIVCSLVDISSDSRIKNILHPTDSAKDLQTLMGIEITDYQFKDKVGNGNAPQKKVIAQQVEQIFPQAVSVRKGVVPDIFKNAAVKEGWVMLATDLKVGERVRLVSSGGESVEEVLEVRGDAFRTSLKSAEEKTFVYGREVPDFHSVDYDAIAMLNVSATQELARQLKTVQDENAALRRELAAKDDRMEARMIALEARLSKDSAPEAVSLKTVSASK
jgi:hypothetical protein